VHNILRLYFISSPCLCASFPPSKTHLSWSVSIKWLKKFTLAHFMFYICNSNAYMIVKWILDTNNTKCKWISLKDLHAQHWYVRSTCWDWCSSDIKLAVSSSPYQARKYSYEADISSAHTNLVLSILRYQDKYHQSIYTRVSVWRGTEVEGEWVEMLLNIWTNWISVAV
jgi:hypothetical protein